MKRSRVFAAAVGTATLAVLACGKKEPASAENPAAAATVRKIVEEKPAPYTYAPPVKGSFHEINIGSFDLVDGIAFPAASGAGTVVYATSKPIASPVLAESACPMMQARVLTEIRDAGFAEVTLNAAGRSKYFASGKAFGGQSREEGAGEWSSRMRQTEGRASGSVRHKRRGSFDFDLPISSPQVREVSEGDRIQGRRSDESLARPSEQAVTAAYSAVRDAARKSDAKALLTALGFDEKQIRAIRGLDGIDGDLAAYGDRFFAPGTPGEFTSRPGTGYVRAEGTNSQGKKFVNFYHFAPCRDRLVLVSIAENPQ